MRPAIRHQLGQLPAILARNHDRFHAQDRHASVLTVEGALDFSILTQAFEAIYQTHPLLRATILFDGTDQHYYFNFSDDFAAIKIEHIEEATPDRWRIQVEKKLAQQFPVSDYLWEMTFISEEGGKRHHLIQHFHHVKRVKYLDQKSDKTIFCIQHKLEGRFDENGYKNLYKKATNIVSISIVPIFGLWWTKE